MFSGLFHDVLRMFSSYLKDTQVGLAGLIALLGVVGLVGLVSLIGLVGLEILFLMTERNWTKNTVRCHRSLTHR